MREIKMKTKNLRLFFYILFFLSIAELPAIEPDSKSFLLHESLGPVIDSTENNRYNIFGDIPGLTAARFHQVKKEKVQLHLLRNIKDGAQLLILNPDINTLQQLKIRTANRFNTAEETQHFDQPLYTVQENLWGEPSEKKLILRDGSQLVGTLERAQTDTLTITTAGGLLIAVPDSKIMDIANLYGEIVEGKYYRIDPNTSRLFFAPTGRGIKSGQGYFADYFIFFPTLAFGVTDFFTISGGMSLLPGAESQLLHFAPKLSFELSPNMDLGTGLLYLGIPGEDDLTLAYAVTTYGDARRGVTVGIGAPFGTEDAGFILLVGGEIQISNGAKLLTENWIFTRSEMTLLSSTGVRFFGERLAVDLGLVTSEEAFGEGGFPFFPWVDFSVFFGK